VSHINVAGHIILVIGYENYISYSSLADFGLIGHDPYGQFDPSLRSKLFDTRRWEGGVSLLGGGEKAPGMSTRLPTTAVGRHRPGDAYFGTYYLLSGHR
jgi:hypothetical protein